MDAFSIWSQLFLLVIIVSQKHSECLNVKDAENVVLCTTVQAKAKVKEDERILVKTSIDTRMREIDTCMSPLSQTTESVSKTMNIRRHLLVTNNDYTLTRPTLVVRWLTAEEGGTKEKKSAREKKSTHRGYGHYVERSISIVKSKSNATQPTTLFTLAVESTFLSSAVPVGDCFVHRKSYLTLHISRQQVPQQQQQSHSSDVFDFLNVRPTQVTEVFLLSRYQSVSLLLAARFVPYHQTTDRWSDADSSTVILSFQDQLWLISIELDHYGA